MIVLLSFKAKVVSTQIKVKYDKNLKILLSQNGTSFLRISV